jgi:NAD(P)-dependent dehydrogenase (short-subunit alcohol dehydrogenase family)
MDRTERERSDLEDRVCIVTGAASGIGRAAAGLFAAHGARVAAFDVDRDAGAEVVRAIRDGDGEAAFYGVDVSDDAAVRAAVKRAADEFGRIDVLFNVAGVSGRKWGDGPVHACTEEAWDNVMSVNLKSVYLCCKYAVGRMLESGRGVVINLSSVLALQGGDDDFATHAYAAGKGGIVSLTRSMARFYAKRNIRANVICPGLIATGMSARAQGDPYILERLADLQPLTGTFGRPADVAEAALFLASDRSAFITGAVLPVDGGWTT